MQLPKKANRLARASALSTRVSEEAVRIVEDFNFEAPRTSDLAKMLKAFELDSQKVLILTPDYQPALVKSADNLQFCSIRVGIEASTYDLLNHRVCLIMQGALNPITEVLRGRKRSTEKAA